MKQVIQAQLAQKNIKADSIEIKRSGIEISFSNESERAARAVNCYTVNGRIEFSRFSDLAKFVSETPCLPMLPVKKKQSLLSSLLSLSPFSKAQPTF